MAIFSTAAVLAAGTSFAVSATDMTEIVLTEMAISGEAGITPYYNQSVTTPLGISGFDYVGGDNNAFAVDLTITNAARNLGSIVIQITDEDGLILVNSSTIAAGESGTFTIPFDVDNIS